MTNEKKVSSHMKYCLDQHCYQKLRRFRTGREYELERDCQRICFKKGQKENNILFLLSVHNNLIFSPTNCFTLIEPNTPF